MALGIYRDRQSSRRRLGLGAPFKSTRQNRLVNQWASDHCHILAASQPILALDMYEHSYHMDFGAKAGGYVDVSMDAVRWANATALYERYSQVV